MPKTTAIALSKHDKNKMTDIIKKMKLMNLNDKAIMDAINFHTGRTVTKGQLQELIEMAKKEVREQEIEVDKHMEHMVRFGLYVDTMNNHEQLNTVQQIIFGGILEEEVKPPEQKNMNKILAMSNTLRNIITAKDNIVTNIAFLTKTRSIFENTQKIDLDNPQAPAIELKDSNKPMNIMIKDQKTDLNELIDEVIDKKELENNRVA